jgi:hypothetical protein
MPHPHELPCAWCGKPVEPSRLCYVIPTCYGCLPPPPPLERVWVGAPNVVDLVAERHRRAGGRS